MSLAGTIFMTLKIDAEFIETYTNDCSQEELVVGVNKKSRWMAVFAQQVKPQPPKLNLSFVLRAG